MSKKNKLVELEPKVLEWTEKLEKIISKKMYDSIVYMEDTHYTGANTAPVGFTCHMDSHNIIPEFITADISCGVSKFNIKTNLEQIKDWDQIVNNAIIGLYNNKVNSKVKLTKLGFDTYLKIKLNVTTDSKFLTLGGGNHFIEISKNDKNEYALFVHSGSRNFGGQIYKYWIEKRKNIWYTDYIGKKFTILDDNDIKDKNEAFKRLINSYDFSDDFIGFSSDNVDYEPITSHLMHADVFAFANRWEIGKHILDSLNLEYEYDFNTVHNYWDTDQEIVRKGAIKAAKRVLIPLNIKEGVLEIEMDDSYINNKERNYSLPHGLGRTCSRTEVLKILRLDEYIESTKDIKSMTINRYTLDESPKAYKSKDILNEIVSDNKNKVIVWKPVYSFKENEQWIKDNVNKKQKDVKK